MKKQIVILSMWSVRTNAIGDECCRYVRHFYNETIVSGLSPEEFVKYLNKEIEPINALHPRCQPFEASVSYDPSSKSCFYIKLKSKGKRLNHCCTMHCVFVPRVYVEDKVAGVLMLQENL